MTSATALPEGRACKAASQALASASVATLRTTGGRNTTFSSSSSSTATATRSATLRASAADRLAARARPRSAATLRAVAASSTTTNWPSKGPPPSQDNAAENRTGAPGPASVPWAPKGSATTDRTLPCQSPQTMTSPLRSVPHRTTPSMVNPVFASEETSSTAPRARAEGSALKSETSATSSRVVRSSSRSLVFAETLTKGASPPSCSVARPHLSNSSNRRSSSFTSQTSHFVTQIMIEAWASRHCLTASCV
mmetsp:Transcript_22796/g.59356  ORF Transcript_22796/g.59356 Transcript_22796/m.59356 type:complete len:252 (-) Transcript_22796:721-1476(-)